jgi:glc operon protein GlcG
MKITLRAFALIAMLMPIAASAQQGPPPYGTSINLEDARKIIAAAEAEAKKNNLSMVITILDASAHMVAMVRMDGTQLGSIAVAEGKARTAVEFRRSTKVVEDMVSGGGAGVRYLSMPMMAVEGGEMIVSGGKLIGSIGVSGGSSAQDGQVARAALAAIK